MGTKEELLKLFENNKGTYFSGEEIASALSVSRSAVWKAVKSLQGKGYPIEAVSGKGYCLLPETDILSSQGVAKYLTSACREPEITVFQTIDSTNTAVREQAAAGASEGLVIIASEQTAGRGRLGRSFHSPAGTGIYMSILLRPENCPAEDAVKLTTMAAVSICEAIEAVSDEKAEIKWVNDVFVNRKKVCGILTEGSFNFENGLLDYAVVGIGINVFTPAGGFPEEIADIAGAVFNAPVNDGKNHLAAQVLNSFFGYYYSKDWDSFVESYRNKSFVIGKEINVCRKDNIRKATALDIDRECRLLVRYESGETEALSSGEISIRL